MTRHYAAIKLFEHGPLSHYEFLEITGWTKTTAGETLYRLVDEGQLKRVQRGVYELAKAA